MEDYIKKAVEMVMEYTPKLLGAIALLIVGLIVIKSIVKYTKKAMGESDMDETLTSFLGSILGAVLKVALVLAVADQLGLEATSLWLS